MSIRATDTQTAHRINLRLVKRFLSQMALNLQGLSPDTTWSDISLVLTDNAGISRINSRYLHVSDPTDVIAFRYDPIPGEGDCASGEIFVNVERAVECGGVHGNSSRELALYIAHGCDHLARQTDDSPAGYARMRRRELRWLKKAAESGLLQQTLFFETGAKHGRTS